MQDEMDKITIAVSSLGMGFPNGMNENQNPYLDYLEKNTNLEINVMLPPLESYEEKLNLLLTSSVQPDLLYTGNKVWFANHVYQGRLRPLDEEIANYGPELLEKIPKEAWEQVTFNGRIYAIPSMNEVKGSELMYVRKDWLDRLGLKPPTTLEEYYEVIRAFAWEDPDNNGKHDTTGLLVTENLGRTAPFFGAFGIQLDQWIEQDGRLVYSSTTQQAKAALGFLRRLYKEGLIDVDFPLNRIQNMYYDKVVSGKVGLFSAAWYDTRGPIEQNRRRDSKAEWVPLDYPVGPKGHSGVYAVDMIRGYNVVPDRNRNAASVVKLLNFIAGAGHRDLKLGFENEVWSMQDGKMVTNFAEHNKHIYRGIYSALVDVVEPDLVKQRLDSLGEQFHLYDNLQRIEKHLIADQYGGPPTPAMGRYMPKLTQAINDLFIRMIVGVVPLESFEEHVERWNAEGLEAVTEEVNAWYTAAAIAASAP